MLRFLLNRIFVCAHNLPAPDAGLRALPYALSGEAALSADADTLFSAVLVGLAGSASGARAFRTVLLHVFGLLDTYAALILPLGDFDTRHFLDAPILPRGAG